jgi:hypothetical protein
VNPTQTDGLVDTVPSRAQLVAQAVEKWTDDLSALGGRDPLLSYRDLKVGTLDLAAAEPEARRLLLEGERVLISKLFPYEPLRSSALRSVRAIRDKTRELADERGLQVCFLAVGIATWANPFAARRPTAPVMLRSAAVLARDPAETDFVVTVANDPFVNPVLLHALDTQLGLRFDGADLRDPAGRLRYATVVERLREFAPPYVVDGFSIAHRAVLATFTTVPLTLSRDLSALNLQDHDVVAALAGDAQAQAALARPGTSVVPLYRVLDTNAEQDGVLETVSAEGHVRVDAPPGTGRTQTIAALIAELVGRGQRVLVVSQKRAFLNDLVGRLHSAGLDDVVLDTGRISPADAVAQIIDTARQLSADSPVHVHDEGLTDGSITTLTAELDAYRDAIHDVRQPWGCTAYDAMVQVATSSENARTTTRIDPDAVTQAGAVTDVRAKLREYADLEGLTLNDGASPWHGADVRSDAVASDLEVTVTELRERALPQLRDAATRAAVEVGLSGPNTVSECVETVALLASVARTVDVFGPQIWDEPLDQLASATGDRAFRTNSGLSIGLLARRRLRRRVAELASTLGRNRHKQHEALICARDQLVQWRTRARDSRHPRTGPHLTRAVEAADTFQNESATLVTANPRTSDLNDLPFDDVVKRLDELVGDMPRLRSLPRLHELRVALAAAGLDDLVAELRRRRVATGQVEAVFDYAWYSSLLDLWRQTDSTLGGFDRHTHERRLEEFCALDLADPRTAVGRVLDAWSVHFAAVAAEHEGQALVLTESSGRGLPSTLPQLVQQAPDVALAAVPCWVVSPYTVADTLPARQLFDVVIIEDASRLAVADSIPAVARGARLVLMADDEVTRQAFTTAVEPAPDPDEHEGPWGHEPPASIVDILRDVLPERSLTGQYRARDDRLVGFAARTIYAGRLTPVPGAGGWDRLTMDVVEAVPAANGDSDTTDPVDSSTAEVARVVELVLDHVRTRPHESLGVVTLGPRHAERLDAAVRHALIRAPEVAGFLRDDRAEPFFIKDVERAAGDVRDAVILSLGYGRSVDGRLLYRFGALGRPGGERRLTAAASCARERLTVVATFGADDLSPRRLTTAGAQALGRFLGYVQHRTAPVEESAPPESPKRRDNVSTPADALAAAVADRLQEAGVAAPVVVGHGGAGGVAVAVRHPTRRDRFVLAVETDGPAYAGRRSARERERLRPTQLERLGWKVYRVWSAAWAADPDGETERLVAAYEQAVADADAYDWAVAAAEADIVAGMPDHDDSQSTPSGAPDAEQIGEAGEPPQRIGPRPLIVAGHGISDYTGRELAAIARWVESDTVVREEDDTTDLVSAELGLPTEDARTRDVLRHAVRVARAGAPAL